MYFLICKSTLSENGGLGRGDEKEKIDIYAPTNGDDDVIVNYVNETKKTTSLMIRPN